MIEVEDLVVGYMQAKTLADLGYPQDNALLFIKEGGIISAGKVGFYIEDGEVVAEN